MKRGLYLFLINTSVSGSNGLLNLSFLKLGKKEPPAETEGIRTCWIGCEFETSLLNLTINATSKQ